MNALVLAALLQTMRADAEGAGCDAHQLQTAAQHADISDLGSIAGRRVVLAAISAPCLCGNVNCPFMALQLDGARARVLLSTYAFDVAPIDASKPLPRLRERAHDSALLSVETIDAWRDGRYLPVETLRRRNDTGETKPDRIPLAFAPGASSATVHGSVAVDWGDRYTVRAAKGQRVSATLDGSGLTATIQSGNGNWNATLGGANVVTLPAGGAYDVTVETQSERRTTYALTIAIR